MSYVSRQSHMIEEWEKSVLLLEMADRTCYILPSNLIQIVPAWTYRQHKPCVRALHTVGPHHGRSYD